ncbi:hypothetical protein CCACVL1_15934, partial [Corchorus capsularis]
MTATEHNQRQPSTPHYRIYAPSRIFWPVCVLSRRNRLQTGLIGRRRDEPTLQAAFKWRKTFA